MRILVCGGRDYTDKDKLFGVLAPYLKEYNSDLEIITGMAKGADSLAWLFAHTYDLKMYEFPADWKHQSNAAGPIRNQKMLDEGKPDLVLAFPTENSKGTWHMIKIAKAAGVPVSIY